MDWELARVLGISRYGWIQSCETAGTQLFFLCVCVEINPQMSKMSGSGHNKNVTNEVLFKSANMFSHFLY